MKRTAPIVGSFTDPLMERIRLNHELRLSELQASADIVEIAPGKLLNLVSLSGSGVYVPTRGTTRVKVLLQGAGGGGGGTTGVLGIAGGSGGNSGYFTEFFIVVDNAGAFSVGLGGTGVLGANGNTGGSTTLTLNGYQFVAGGGAGGSVATLSNGGVAAPQAQPGTIAVNAPGYYTYGLGGLGLWVLPGFGVSGKGGDSLMGLSGTPVATGGVGTVNGVAGFRGGGGSGSVGNSGGVAQTSTGGSGGDGYLLIYEYS